MRRLILVTVIAVLVTACGSSSDTNTTSPDLSLLGTPVDSAFRPSTGGFSFANFTQNDYAARFTVDDLVDTVGGGSRVCVDAIDDPCIPTDEARAFIDVVESSRRAGHCEGMVVLAAVRHSMGLAPATAELQPTPRVVDAIIRAFSTIFLPEVQAEERTWQSRSLDDDVATLTAALSKGRLDYGLGLYLEEGGHELLPYAIEYPEPRTARIRVYDPNWPGVERWVDVDLDNDTWRFSFAGVDPDADTQPWSGTHEQFSLNSISVRANALEARGVELTPRE